WSAFSATPPSANYALSLHDALPIWPLKARSARSTGPTSSTTLSTALIPWRRPSSNCPISSARWSRRNAEFLHTQAPAPETDRGRSEEHTSELQSRVDLVCRLLLEKK